MTGERKKGKGSIKGGLWGVGGSAATEVGFPAGFSWDVGCRWALEVMSIKAGITERLQILQR